MSEPKTSKECTKPTDEVKEPEESENQEGREKGEEPKDKTYVPPPPYKPPIPYPQRLKQTQINNQYQKFIKVIEKLHVEIPFTVSHPLLLCHPRMEEHLVMCTITFTTVVFLHSYQHDV